jgi:hypothetical protein
MRNDAQRESRNVWRKKRKAWLEQLKDNRACTDCGQRYRHWQLDYDHLPGTIKRPGGVAKMVGVGTSQVKLLSELAKCELVCANCHRTRTWARSHDGEY